MDWYIHPSVNQSALQGLFDGLLADGLELHSLQIARGDTTLVRLAAQPYCCADVREVYSLSKPFTATLVGIAVDRGLLREDDTVAGLLGRAVSPRMGSMTVRHVLSMNTGHDRCLMPEMLTAENSVDAFLAAEPAFDPGTHFLYNTGATCLLTAILEKVTGQRFFDFACENLLYPLGITDAAWKECFDGKSIGGAGLQASSDDLLKLARLFAAEGVYEGRPIVSKEWIRKASSFVSDNAPNVAPDWANGYGYQLWRNARDGCRGDGAFGQFLLILPKYDVVLVMQALCGDMQKELNHIYTFLDHFLDPDEAVIAPFAYPPAASALPRLMGIYRLAENPFGLSSLRAESGEGGVRLSFADGSGIQTVLAKPGCWTTNRVLLSHFQPRLFGYTDRDGKEALVLDASCREDGGRLLLDIRYRTSPHKETWILTVTGENIRLDFQEPWDTAQRLPESRLLRGKRI